MTPELVIFDCDGVLVDSEPIANRILVAALAEAGYAIDMDQAMARFVGRGMAAVVAMVEAEHGRPLPPDFLERLQARTFAAFRAELRPIPGIRQALAAITAPVCVASSGSHQKIALSLSLCGLDAAFRGRVFSAADVTRGKPHPELFLHASQRLGARPEASVVVEDSVVGVAAAAAAGMIPLGFAGGSHGGPALARRLGEAGARVFDRMVALPGLLSAL